MLFYSIKDPYGHDIVFKKESLVVDNRTTLLRKLQVPPTADLGGYVFYTKISWNNVTAVSSSTFSITAMPHLSRPNVKLSIKIIVILLVISTIVFLIYYILYYIYNNSRKKIFRATTPLYLKTLHTHANLLEVGVTVAKKTAEQDSKIEAKIHIKSKLNKKANIWLHYAIKTASGAIISDQRAIIPILKEINIKKWLHVPINAPPGMYRFYIKAYINKTKAEDSDEFEIIQNPKKEIL